MSRTPQTVKRRLGWREPILKHFTSEIAEVTQLTVVSDPDDLLTEQEILRELEGRGFEIVLFEDHVGFRFSYESRYRQVWDRGEKTNLVVVLRSGYGEMDSLPYDLLEKAKRQERCLSFSVGNLFPRLVPNVVLGLDRSCFDDLYAAHAQDDSARLGVDATKDFVLRHVFQIAPELIKTTANLLQVLLRRHYRGFSFPRELDERFIGLLSKEGQWDGWPLAEIIPHRAAFIAFLNERWPKFLQQSIDGEVGLSREIDEDRFQFSGPVDLPFGHDDVKVYIDNLFQEGQLTPVDGYSVSQISEEWMRVGVSAGNKDDILVRFRRLFARLKKEFPQEDAGYRDWVGFAQTWAEWAALRWELVDAELLEDQEGCEKLHDQIEESFTFWMIRNYASLHNLSSYNRPVMVHHIAQHMARDFIVTGAQASAGGPPRKHALIVVDGLALDQWVVLRDIVLSQIDVNIKIDQDASFAWVPTLTGVSRQSIFSGTQPLFLGSSIGKTSAEPSHWRRFWEEKGAKRSEIGYVREGKNQSDKEFLRNVFVVAEHPKTRMLGVVVGKVDQSLHGIKTGSAGLHAVVRQWAHSGAIGELLTRLLDLDFEIIVTSDHGNIHGNGIGKPAVGVVANERGERAHVFNDENTRAGVAKDYPDAIIWPQIGLPEDWRVLLAPGRSAFVPKSQQTVAHGGIGMEEVIVPFVRIQGCDE